MRSRCLSEPMKVIFPLVSCLNKPSNETFELTVDNDRPLLPRPQGGSTVSIQVTSH